ncbi:MAG: 4Fe-4S dicluster domain-containing protein [candidate division Zixibacteria bacterium]|nr:4Fe-4S dicluster domain-containing protein [candidate division Zixibacteria bacterium]
MTLKTLTKDQFNEFVNKLIASNRVVGVKEKEKKFFVFDKLEDTAELRLDYDVAYLSPRKYFQPPRETLLKFTTKPNVKAEPVVEAKPFILLGVHPYDMKAINQMTTVFTKDNEDTNYLARREAATIIAIDPQTATDWSFWPWMNATTVDKGWDLFITDIGDAYVDEIGTDKGKALLEKNAQATDATNNQAAKRDEIRANLKNLCKQDRAINVPANDIGALVAKSEDHPVWEENAEKCYSCGTCNQVCPTCYCFDIREDLNLELTGGERVRRWDGCLLQDFASVASGENFREDRANRFRHRIMRKCTYVPQIVEDDLACVGCGRCSSQCLPDIADPVKIINKLAEGK